MNGFARYKREWFCNIRGDILSGIVVALALIPEAIGFSVIAGVDPNVDYALAVLALHLGLPHDSGLTLFAIGRTAGWTAHAIEQRASETLIRPRARYTGVAPRISTNAP